MPDGVILVDKPAGITSHDVVARAPRHAGPSGQGRPRRHARPVRDRAAARAGRPRDARAALPDGAAEALRDGRAAGLDVDDRRPRRRDRARAGCRPSRSRCRPASLRQRPPAYSAVKVGGRRAYALARAGETVELPEREVTVTRFEPLWRDGDRAAFAIDCSSGTYVRSLVPDLGDAYCLELRRTAIGPFDVQDADPERLVPLDDALGFLPELRLSGEDAKRAAHGVAVPGEATGEVRLTDAAGLIAIGEPREGGLVAARRARG